MTLRTQLRSQLRSLYRRLRSSNTPSFHTRPYAERVRIIQQLYSHTANVDRLERYFASDPKTETVRSPFYDILSGYADVLRPATIHQIGCFTATESRWLADTNYPGTIIASDFDPARIDYLRQKFQGTPYERIDLRVLDLESRDYRALHDTEMAATYAVFSNVQPETIDHFFSTLKDSRLKLLFFRDVVQKNSFTLRSPDRSSLPSAVDNNWFHRYLAVAAHHGLQAFFLPEFTAQSEAHASCLFVVHNNVPEHVHSEAVAKGLSAYRARQAVILEALEASER